MTTRPRPGDLALTLPGAAARGGYIYLAETDAPNGAIKIGQTKNLVNRLSSLRNGCPYELWINAWYWVESPVEEEQRLFERFAHVRIRGEWFGPDPDLLRFVDELAQLRTPEAVIALLSRPQ